MNTLLLFFVLPVATIILAIVFEKILRCPILTAATFFAIYLILAFTVFDESFLIFVIAYTIIAFVCAFIAEYFLKRCISENVFSRFNICKESNNTTSVLSNQDVRRIARELLNMQNCNCNNSENDVVTVNTTNNATGRRTSWCCYRK